MLIPSIDLQGGRIVQLVQGERLALESRDIDGWIARFRSFPCIQVIDLDAAMSKGSNARLVRRLCRALPCRVGGGIRTIERAREILEIGAQQVIVGSALFRDGRVDRSWAAQIPDALDVDRVVAAVDSRRGRVVVGGWRVETAISAVEAVRELDPFVGGFLYTHVDREGLMQGTELDAIRAVRQSTAKPVTAAGGITTWSEIEYLDSIGVDAVVGMALYTGRLLASVRTGSSEPPK